MQWESRAALLTDDDGALRFFSGSVDLYGKPRRGEKQRTGDAKPARGKGGDRKTAHGGEAVLYSYTKLIHTIELPGFLASDGTHLAHARRTAFPRQRAAAASSVPTQTRAKKENAKESTNVS